MKAIPFIVSLFGPEDQWGRRGVGDRTLVGLRLWLASLASLQGDQSNRRERVASCVARSVLPGDRALLAQDDELHASVLRPAGLAVTAAQRPRLTVPVRREPPRLDAVVDQVGLHRLGAILGEPE